MNPDIESQIMQTPEGVWVLKNDTHLSRWIEQHKRLDIAEAEIAHYKEFIPEGGVVIDAGACLGDHTATYAKLVGSKGRVWAFEPRADTFECLARNMQPYWWVEVRNFALGAAQGMGHIQANENAGASRIFEKDLVEKVGGDATGQEIKIMPLDQFFLDGERVDFIHFDLEGFEIDALRGAEQLIQRFKPTIVLEVNKPLLYDRGYQTKDLAVYAYLSTIGYEWRETEPHHGPHLEQRDILCRPKS